MPNFKTVLLAVELIPENDQSIISKAEEIVKEFNAKLHLIHVVEHVNSYGAAYGVAVGADIEQVLIENAKKDMQALAEKHGIAKEAQWVQVGSAGQTILESAEKINADLIIIGSHGRQGLRLLLGSTANAVLHGAKCDVLAVRLKK